MTYELKSEQFTGPLEKLLELIEARQMDITQISLAQVTDDFLKYLKTLTDAEQTQTDAEQTQNGAEQERTDAEGFSMGQGSFRVVPRMDLRMVADFIAVASRLILIKSKYLLPDLTLTEEEETGMKDLERRLKIYQELKPALKTLAKLWSGGDKEFSRGYFMVGGFGSGSPSQVSHGEIREGKGGSGFFYPGKKLGLDLLLGAMRDIFKDLENMELETKVIKEKIITIGEKMKEIVRRMQKEVELNLNALSGDKSRANIIITFLAILHLAREQLILLEQNSAFSDIMITKKRSE